MIDETLESAAGDLAEARDKIDAVRESLEDLMGAQQDFVGVRLAAARLERIERACAGQLAAVAGR